MYGKLTPHYISNFKEHGGKMRKTYKRSEEDKQKISERSRARWANPEYREKMKIAQTGSHVGWNKGMKMLEKYPNWGMVGKKHSVEWWKKYGEKFTRKGKKASPETINKQRESHLKIPHNGKQDLKQRIRGGWEYKIWRNSILERDGNCIKCGSNTKLQVDHIVAFQNILEDFLNHYNQFSELEDKETLVRLSRNWKEFWDIDNGRTLCKRCHLNR